MNKEKTLLSLSILNSKILLFKSFSPEFIKNKSYLKIIQFLQSLDFLSQEHIIFTMRFILMLKGEFAYSGSKYRIQIIHKLMSSGIDLENETIRNLFISVIALLMNNSTLTMQMLVDKEINLHKLYNEYPKDCKEISKYIHFLGIKSLDVIMDLVNNKILIDHCSALHCIQLIPIHIKLQRTFDIIDVIESILQTKDMLSLPDQRQINNIVTGFYLIYELMHAGREAKELNRQGKCYKNPLGYNVTPIMIYCKNCNNFYCIACGQ